MKAEVRDAVRQILGDAALFAKLHRVQHKESKQLIPFEALPMQQRIFDAVRAGHKRIIVVKARQVAATTGCKLVLHHLAYTTRQEAMHAIISMRSDSASALLDDHRRWCADPPQFLRRPHKVARTRLRYTDTGASIQAYTSRSQTGLRSFTPAAALISEAAYAPDLAEVLAQVDAAVGTGLLLVESTANRPGDAFAQLVQGAPENGWHLLTMWWWEHPAYTLADAELDPAFKMTADEAAEAQRYSLTPGQVQWRRQKVGLLGSEEKFRREYPGCLEDAFLSTTGLYYSALDMQHIGAQPAPLTPEQAPLCTIGVDVGGGVGGDYHALVVVCAISGQVAYWERDNRMSPAQWAQRVLEVAARYSRGGPPLVLCESNNHGHVVIDRLQQARYARLWIEPRTGRPWTTTLQSKLEAHGELRAHLPLIARLPAPISLELRALQIPPGKLAPEAPAGGNDDYAMATALAYRALRDIPPGQRGYLTPSTLSPAEQLMAAHRARRTGTLGGV